MKLIYHDSFDFGISSETAMPGGRNTGDGIRSADDFSFAGRADDEADFSWQLRLGCWVWALTLGCRVDGEHGIRATLPLV